MVVRNNLQLAINAGIRAVPVKYNGGEIVALRRGLVLRDHRTNLIADDAVAALVEPLLKTARSDSHVNLRKVDAYELVGSFMFGMASIFIDSVGDAAVGYARLKPRLTDGAGGTKDRLGITIPETIYEMGTVIVSGNKPDGTPYRSNGLAGKLIGDMIGISGIRPGGDTLIIATMKEAKTMVAFQNAFTESGYSNLKFSHHLDFTEISRLTCTCDGEFGSGFQIAPAPVCFARIGDTSMGPRDTAPEYEALARLNARDLPRHENGRLTDEGKRILDPLNGRCVLFVSDLPLAQSVNERIDTSALEAKDNAQTANGPVKVQMPGRRG